MFSNLSKGSILHGVDCRGDMRWFTGSVEKVTPSLNKQYPNTFNQFPSLSLDVVVNIDGEQKEFKQLPSNDFIADFGDNTFIISDNKDSLYNYVKSLLRKSEDATNEDILNYHRTRIPKLKNVLSEMMPGINNANEVKELKDQVSSLQAQLAEALSLLKGEDTKSKK